ncbi:MAG TPA: SCO family protein [Povalibacter sp.]|uniref:SCO family protein n=1 Tax=Povalibacter sp. TaxID=1962978 RepID=UPI002C3A5851|nr:SCO family protein [Povalibacter sp.]HMN45677.1 SCO family protein [Povalibacter sp.]
MSRKQSIAIAAVVAIVAIASGMLLARSVLNPRGGAQLGLAQATALEPARALPTFKLIDQSGGAFDAARLQNRWSLLFFGFTHCPDVCPTTLGVLAQTEKLLADLPESRRPQIVLVSVDPKRDTPEQLASYVKFFSPSFTGVTGTQDDIDAFTRALGVPVATSPLPNGDYTVDHSAALFLVNPAGQLRALFSGPHTAAVIADDYRRIVEAG